LLEMRFVKAGFALALVVRVVATQNRTNYFNPLASISTVTETASPVTVTVTPKCPDQKQPSVWTETVTVTKDAPNLLDATGASTSHLLHVTASVAHGGGNYGCESATKTVTKICGSRILDIDINLGDGKGDDDCLPVERPTTITKEIFITKTVTLVGLARIQKISS